jgi:hypothetical protein
MVIKCSFLISLESVGHYAKHFADSPPLPEYIIKTGPYVNNKGGGVYKIIILYKFGKSKFAEAWENISKQLGCFGGLSGFTISTHIYGPHPYHLTLEKGEEIKKYPGRGSMEASASVLRTAYEY